MTLTVENLTLKYKFGATAVQNLTFSAKKGEIFCIYGKSESGKTSLLKALSGLFPVKNGKITLDKTDYASKSVREKNVFLMHEDLGFFENKTLKYNLEYPLKIRNDDNASDKVSTLAKKYGLSDLLDAKAKKISPTDRLNAAFLRCENRNADLYLFDNPFNSLPERTELFAKFLPLLKQKASESVVIYATDDVEEVKKINGSTLIINYGIKHQIGIPDEIKNNPSSAFVYKIFYPNAEEYFGKIIDKNTLDFNNKEYFIDKKELLNDIFIGKVVKVCVNANNIETAKIYDLASEKLIYFAKIV